MVSKQMRICAGDTDAVRRDCNHVLSASENATISPE
jgi:hypothetical protein